MRESSSNGYETTGNVPYVILAVVVVIGNLIVSILRFLAMFNEFN